MVSTHHFSTRLTPCSYSPLTSSGIGAAFIPLLLSRPTTTVLALHRATSAIQKIPASSIHPTSALHTYHYQASASEVDIHKLSEQIQAEHKIVRIAVVLAAAGMVEGMKPVLTTTWTETQKHMDVNFGGPLKLIQGFRGLLGLDTATATANPGSKFILISSSVGSLGGTELVPGCLAYGASKAAANYLITRLHVELAAQNFVAVAIHPGWVQTRMGWHAAEEWGMKREIVPLTPEESVTAIMKIVDEADWKKTGGKFLSYDGSTLPW